jgi:hypothetical protein
VLLYEMCRRLRLPTIGYEIRKKCFLDYTSEVCNYELEYYLPAAVDPEAEAKHQKILTVD